MAAILSTEYVPSAGCKPVVSKQCKTGRVRENCDGRSIIHSEPHYVHRISRLRASRCSAAMTVSVSWRASCRRCRCRLRPPCHRPPGLVPVCRRHRPPANMSRSFWQSDTEKADLAREKVRAEIHWDDELEESRHHLRAPWSRYPDRSCRRPPADGKGRAGRPCREELGITDVRVPIRCRRPGPRRSPFTAGAALPVIAAWFTSTGFWVIPAVAVVSARCADRSGRVWCPHRRRLDAKRVWSRLLGVFAMLATYAVGAFFGTVAVG